LTFRKINSIQLPCEYTPKAIVLYMKFSSAIKNYSSQSAENRSGKIPQKKFESGSVIVPDMGVGHCLGPEGNRVQLGGGG
jgi:hypothetical protein